MGNSTLSCCVFDRYSVCHINDCDAYSDDVIIMMYSVNHDMSSTQLGLVSEPHLSNDTPQGSAGQTGHAFTNPFPGF